MNEITLREDSSAKRQLSRCELSVVIPVYNEAEGIAELYSRLLKTLQPSFQSFELIFVDDGSSDQSYAVLSRYAASDSRVRILGLSRNFGKEIALTAGLDHACGDFVVPLDADLQDPPELILPMVEKAKEGFDVVYGARTVRYGEVWLKRATAWAFYKLAKTLSSVRIPENTGDFRVMRREVIDALKLVREKNRFMKGVFSWVGFKQVPFFYERHPRFTGKTSWNYFKLFDLAIECITSFSTAPLRFASYSGLGVALIAFLMALFYAVKAICYGDNVQGFPTLIVAILFLGGLQLFCLGILGEYIGRIYLESKHRPLYLLRRKSNIGSIQDSLEE